MPFQLLRLQLPESGQPFNICITHQPMQFCRECNNLLYPKMESGVLQYVCQRCDTTVDPASSIVTSFEFIKSHSKLLTARKNLLHDPTLPRFKIKCQTCGNSECIGYMEPSEEKALNSYYVCTKCYSEWNDDQIVV